jgi:hypothetical protein
VKKSPIAWNPAAGRLRDRQGVRMFPTLSDISDKVCNPGALGGAIFEAKTITVYFR